VLAQEDYMKGMKCKELAEKKSMVGIEKGCT